MSSTDLSSSVPAVSASSTPLARQIFIGEIPQPEGWILDPLDGANEVGEIEPVVFSLLPTDFDRLIELDLIKGQIEAEEERRNEQRLSPSEMSEYDRPLATIMDAAMTIKIGRHLYEVTTLEVISQESEKIQVQLGQRLQRDPVQSELAKRRKIRDKEELEEALVEMGSNLLGTPRHGTLQVTFMNALRCVSEKSSEIWADDMEIKDEQIKQLKKQLENAGPRKESKAVKRVERELKEARKEAEELMAEKTQWQKQEDELKNEIEQLKAITEKEIEELRGETKKMEEEVEKVAMELKAEKEEHNKAIEQLRGESKKTKETAKKTGKQN